jgi:hypothetical protein
MGITGSGSNRLQTGADSIAFQFYAAVTGGRTL